MAEGWLTIEEAAQRVGRSKPTIYRWVSEGLLKVISNRIRESQLVDVEREVRTRRASRARRVAVVVAGVRVGELRYNPDTGRLAGDVEPGIELQRLVSPATPESS